VGRLSQPSRAADAVQLRKGLAELQEPGQRLKLGQPGISTPPAGVGSVAALPHQTDVPLTPLIGSSVPNPERTYARHGGREAGHILDSTVTTVTSLKSTLLYPLVCSHAGFPAKRKEEQQCQHILEA
jgi:hypothetical protein